MFRRRPRFDVLVASLKGYVAGVIVAFRMVCPGSLLLLATQLLFAAVPAQGQATGAVSSASGTLRARYDAAQSAQAAAQFPLAAAEYRLFLAEALHRLANGNAAAQNFNRSMSLFAEALDLSPSDVALRLDYAETCLSAKDVSQARTLAQLAVDADPGNARAHIVLGRALLALQENELAKSQLEAAVVLEPTLTNGLLLATTELALKDDKGAGKVFQEMLQGFGDTSELHLQFGQAYATRDYPELAIAEFKKAIAKNDALPHAHYSLGAAYMQDMGEMNYTGAEQEFQKELRNHPDDFLSHLELGYIELSQHRLPEAEAELIRAARLSPEYPDTSLYLGQLFLETDRLPQAEASLRKALVLAQSAPTSPYQIQRAHYLLGRALVQSGRLEEAKKEMLGAQTLENPSAHENQSQMPNLSAMEGKDAPPRQTEPAPVDLQALQNLEAFDKELRPAVADSYNNLGVISAGTGDLSGALAAFQKAATWNPTLEGLDRNWGRAAFSANRYDQAVAPLGRYLSAHPDDEWAREALGMSHFLLKDFSATVTVLRPLESKMEASPQLAYAYAVSLTKDGDYPAGVILLERLEKANPSIALVHCALGEAYAAHLAYSGAADEFRKTLAIDPANDDAKLGLAVSLKALSKTRQASKN